MAMVPKMKTSTGARAVEKVCVCWCALVREICCLRFKNPFSLLQKTVYGANVVIFEGILAFANKELLKVSIKSIRANITCILYTILPSAV